MATLGMVGLGRMGGNMAERLRRGGHTVIGYDHAPDARDVDSLEALVEALPSPRVVWVMVPAGDPTYQTIDALGRAARRGRRRRRRWQLPLHRRPAARDRAGREGHRASSTPGVSGGVWGLTEGYALMVGGEKDAVAKVQPFFDVLKPEGDSGFVHAGEVGAGHFAKMVHNGIEYGLMQAYAEGWELMEATDLITDVPGRRVELAAAAPSSGRGCST